MGSLDNIERQEHHPTNSDPIKKHKKRPRSQKPGGPIHSTVYEYLTNQLPASQLPPSSSIQSLISTLPKRYTVYPPLLLLPAHIFTSTPEWKTLYSSLNEAQRQDLYATILSGPLGKAGVTHVAINAPIKLTDEKGVENRMRSPTGLVPVFGDFGTVVEDGDGDPSERELREAFWVRTVQNGGIVQVWAPLYTMFSRGNVVEKARILGDGERRFEGLDDEEDGGGGLEEMSVVDMYAGIGYFVFSYLKRGVARAWGWEINGWSVEGLRRGCRENGWGVRVVRVGEDGEVKGGIGGLVQSLREERVVLFHGDNTFAWDVMSRVKEELEARGAWKKVRHVNLGLLPTSRPSWESAVRVLDPEIRGWVHVHENVDVKEIEAKKAEVVKELDDLASQHRGRPLSSSLGVECRHVERVKSYAPGVMHCVFDVYIPPHSLPPIDSGRPGEENENL